MNRGGRPVDSAGGGEAIGTRPRREKEFSEIHSAYDLESLLLPVLQYNNLSLSFDFFPQFTWNSNTVFLRYLARAFKLEHGTFRPGEGTILSAGYQGMDAELRIERALLSRETEGDWWKIVHRYFDETIYYEVLVSSTGSPVRIRYLDPETNMHHEVEASHIPELESVGESEPGDSDSADDARSEPELRVQEYAKEWSYAFNEPYIVGEELVEVTAGRFMTVHVSDVYEDEYGTGADYWISPDVPGNIVRIRYSSPGQEPYIVELQELTAGNRSTIDAGVVAGLREEGDSEGSPSEPEVLAIDEPYTGWVAPGGTSYYQVTAQRRADVYISVEVLEGSAELHFYGADPTFYNQRSSSSGGELFAEEYFVEPGVDLFFTVANPSGDEGNRLMISLTQDVFLSPLGIALRGEIYYRAKELKPGRSYEETLNIHGLNYYVTKVSRGRRLEIIASNLPSSVELVWFDAAEGVYSGVYTIRENDVGSIEITGAAPGTLCYFYIVADMMKTPVESIFTLTLEEYAR